MQYNIKNTTLLHGVDENFFFGGGEGGGKGWVKCKLSCSTHDPLLAFPMNNKMLIYIEKLNLKHDFII